MIISICVKTGGHPLIFRVRAQICPQYVYYNPGADLVGERCPRLRPRPWPAAINFAPLPLKNNVGFRHLYKYLKVMLLIATQQQGTKMLKVNTLSDHVNKFCRNCSHDRTDCEQRQNQGHEDGQQEQQKKKKS